jgi:hypothetical protein
MDNEERRKGIMDYYTVLGTTVEVLFVILAYSYLVKDTVLFKFVQSTYVGLGVGHSLVMAAKYLRENTFVTIGAGNLVLIVPFIAGLLLFGRLRRETLWMYRIPLAVLIGTGMAVQLRGMLKASLIDQLVATMKLNISASLDGINSVLVFVFLVSAMSYFFFTVRGQSGTSSTTGTLRDYLMKLGQLVLMGTFGAGFAASFLGRLAVFMGVLQQVIFFIPKLLGWM